MHAEYIMGTIWCSCDLVGDYLLARFPNISIKIGDQGPDDVLSSGLVIGMTPRESDTWAQESAYKARDQAEIWYRCCPNGLRYLISLYREPDPDRELYVMIEDAEYMLSIFAKHNE